MEKLPFLLFGKDFWKGAINIDYLVEQGTVSPSDADLITPVDTAEEHGTRLKVFIVFKRGLT